MLPEILVKEFRAVFVFFDFFPCSKKARKTLVEKKSFSTFALANPKGALPAR